MPRSLRHVSVTVTDGATGKTDAGGANCALPAPTAMPAAGPATPTAEIAIAVKFDPFTFALKTLVPAAVPSVHDPSVATPFAFVVAFAPVMLPPPYPIANVTLAPPIGFPRASCTSTLGGTASVPPRCRLWIRRSLRERPVRRLLRSP